MKRILVIPRISIQNANALSSPYTIGFPAMTAWLGAMRALQLKINAKNSDFKRLNFNGIAVVSHEFNLHTYKGDGGYDYSIVSTSNPLKKDGKRPSTIEEARCHLMVSLAVEYTGIDQDEAEDMLQILDALLYKMKMASGDVLNFNTPFLRKINSEQETRALTARLMPGFCLVERRDLMTMPIEKDSMDMLLHYLKNTSRCEKTTDKNDKEKITWGKPTREEKGWIVPISTGFQGITDIDIDNVQNQRDTNISHRFAESIITLGEFIMPYRITDINQMLWQYNFDKDNNLYLCQQKKPYQPFTNNSQEN